MFRNFTNKGFSLLELMVAVGIGSAVLLGTVQYLNINDKANKKIQRDLEDTSDNLNMEAMLRKDLTNTKHSLNNINILDDSGKNFFDYLSTSTCTSNCKRSLKLEVGTTVGHISAKSLYFIVIDQAAGAEQIYNPADAYVAGTLTFKSLNQDDNLAVRANTPWENVATKSRLIFLYSPLEVFSPTALPQTPGRTLSFMGWVGATNIQSTLNAETINDAGVNFYTNDDPRTSLPIASEDAFFKNMPYTSGLGSFSFLTAVKIVRYRMQTVKSGGKFSGQLMRAEMNDSKVFIERPIGFNIKTLEFTRETISSPAISIKVENVI